MAAHPHPLVQAREAGPGDQVCIGTRPAGLPHVPSTVFATAQRGLRGPRDFPKSCVFILVS